MVERVAQAFKVEFYERAKRQQVRDDLVSYLGEYRFEIPQFNYELGVKEGKLTDPETGDFMTDKARKAIKDRASDGLKTSREFAELKGLGVLESQLSKKGTIIWFSPQGAKEDGYGDYGFAYVGNLEEDKLKMTAIRLESPTLSDFNRATSSLFNKEFETAEEFLSSPQIIDIDQEEVKQFIKGNFYIKDERWGRVFDKSMRSMRNVIDDCVDLIMYGTEEQKHTALHVVENLSIELKAKYSSQLKSENIDYIPLSLSSAMKTRRYTAPPPKVLGSCGATSQPESNDIFKSLNYKKGERKVRKFEFNEPGPCRMCGRDVYCGPCKICEGCNDRIDANEIAA